MSSNGKLDLRDLTKVDGWAYLSPPTAAAWVGFCNEMESLGYPRPTITAPDGAYRNIQQQHYWKAYWTGRGKPGNAATPGYSNHGWGTAIDIFNVYRYPRNVLVSVAAKWGFTFNVPSELWHMQHNGTWPAGGGSTPIEKEEEMPTYELVKAEGSITVWFCVDRLHRYAIPSEMNLADYTNFIKSKGQDASIKTVALRSFGSPIYTDGYPSSKQIADAVVAALPKTGAGLTAAQVEAAVKSAMAEVEVTATVDAQAIAKAVNEDAANRLRD